MSERKPATARGRPPTITRQRIADAGIAIGLPKLSVLGIAAHLGVSHMAIYKHISGLEELKQLVAEEIFLCWHVPPPSGGRKDLESYMAIFSNSMWQLVEEHPGMAPYLLRGDMITPAMAAKIKKHQEEMARLCGISFAQSRWLFITVAYHCIAIADTILPNAIEPVSTEKLSNRSEIVESVIDLDHRKGIHALIVGALTILDDIPGDTIPWMPQ